nr:formyltransferase family protein [Bacillus pacificus]
MKKFAVFASGNGSNFEAIVTRLKEENWNAEVSLLVCDNLEAKVL